MSEVAGGATRTAPYNDVIFGLLPPIIHKRSHKRVLIRDTRLRAAVPHTPKVAADSIGPRRRAGR
jgi:hypothetical protein